MPSNYVKHSDQSSQSNGVSALEHLEEVKEEEKRAAENSMDALTCGRISRKMQ
jgi:hypothetical protein